MAADLFAYLAVISGPIGLYKPAVISIARVWVNPAIVDKGNKIRLTAAIISAPKLSIEPKKAVPVCRWSQKGRTVRPLNMVNLVTIQLLKIIET
jgi:beta-galactosidase/beta-glucuronidase